MRHPLIPLTLYCKLFIVKKAANLLSWRYPLSFNLILKRIRTQIFPILKLLRLWIYIILYCYTYSHIMLYHYNSSALGSMMYALGKAVTSILGVHWILLYGNSNVILYSCYFLLLSVAFYVHYCLCLEPCGKQFGQYYCILTFMYR